MAIENKLQSNINYFYSCINDLKGSISIDQTIRILKKYELDWYANRETIEKHGHIEYKNYVIEILEKIIDHQKKFRI